MSDKGKRILFLGNGVNRVAGRNEPYSWGRLLDEMEASYVPVSERDSGLLYPLRIERIQNYALLEGKEFIEDWREKLKSLKPTFVHRLMAQVFHDSFSKVLTTNYDDAMESALAELPCMKNVQVDEYVTHIHGRASKAASKLVMSQLSYIKATGALSEQEWLDEFCSKEVHICGFAMDAGELLIWSALRERQRRLREQTCNFVPIVNHVFIYLFYTEKDEAQQRALATLLRSYGARPLLIPVPQEDYRAAWLQLYGRMSLILNQQRYAEENSQFVCTEARPQLESKDSPLISAYVPSAKHPNCAWVSVSEAKRNKYPTLCFYIDLDGVVSMWQCSSVELKNSFARLNVPLCSRLDYHLYIDVCKGKLYYAPKGESSMTLLPVANLTRIDSVAHFDHLLSLYKKSNH